MASFYSYRNEKRREEMRGVEKEMRRRGRHEEEGGDGKGEGKRGGRI